MNGQKYTVTQKTDTRLPAEYKFHVRETTRREAGNKLYGILLENKLPAVVDIEEATEREYGAVDYFPSDVFRIDITVTPVQHRHVTWARMDELNNVYSVRPVSLKAKMKRFFQKLTRKP